MGSVTVTAPCTTANLGPGFDVFALALDAFHDTIQIHTSLEESVELEMTGPYSSNVPEDPDLNSAGLVAKDLLSRHKIDAGVKIRVEKGIPVGKGLGSSAASAAATAVGLNSILGLGLTQNENVEMAAQGELASAGAPHADNVAAARNSGGLIETVSDREILEAQKALAGKEGIFVEPASASTIAGVGKLVNEGVIRADEEVVCIATGHGLKNQEAVTPIAEPPVKVKSTQETIAEVLGLRPQLLCRGLTGLPEELLDAVRDVGLVEHSDDPLNEVPLRDETDKAALVDDRQPANLPCEHGIEGFPDGRSRRYCDQWATHQPTYWRVVDPLSLRRAQRPARDVAFCDDSNGLSVLHDDEASNVPFNHDLESLLYGGVGFDRYWSLGHYSANGVLGARSSHILSPAQWFITYALKIHRTRPDTCTSVGTAYCLG
jgi:hypothetical protein